VPSLEPDSIGKLISEVGAGMSIVLGIIYTVALAFARWQKSGVFAKTDTGKHTAVRVPNGRIDPLIAGIGGLASELAEDRAKIVEMQALIDQLVNAMNQKASEHQAIMDMKDDEIASLKQELAKRDRMIREFTLQKDKP
jgi:hypothetical protein